MAWRNGPYAATSDVYLPEAAEGRRLDSNPEFLSVADHLPGAQFLFSNLGGGGSTTVAGDGRTAIYNYTYVNKVEITHNHATVNNTSTAALNDNSSKKPFEPGEPRFQLASSVTGKKFGYKFAKRFYLAEKYVHESHNLVTYTQTRSAAQSAARVLTLGLSPKRTTHFIILLEPDLLQEVTSTWPFHIFLNDFEPLIQRLGSRFECTQTKVKEDRFSLYLFAIKKTGVKLSEECLKSWIHIFYWANNLEASTHDINEGLSSFLASPPSVLDVAIKIGSSLLFGV